MPAGAIAAASPRGPLTSPPEWWEGSDAGAAAAATSSGSIPGEGWPDIETLDYMTKLIILGLLLVATPWVLSKLIASPAEGSKHAAGLLGAR